MVIFITTMFFSTVSYNIRCQMFDLLTWQDNIGLRTIFIGLGLWKITNIYRNGILGHVFMPFLQLVER